MDPGESRSGQGNHEWKIIMNGREMNRQTRLLALSGLLVLSGAAAACSSGDSTPAAAATLVVTSTVVSTAEASAAAATATPAEAPAEPVGVGLAEFSISGPSSVSAGLVTFEVSNGGMAPHNLRVIRSDSALDALPLAAGMADESQLELVAATADIDMGGDDVLVDATLAPGRYLMFCNVLGHYQLGMVKELIVN